MFTFKRGYRHTSLLLGIKSFTAVRKKPREMIYSGVFHNGEFQWMPWQYLDHRALAGMHPSETPLKPITRMNVHFRDSSGRFVSWDKVEKIERELGRTTHAISFIERLRGLPAR